MDKAQALHTFWSGFGVAAYDESTVSDDAGYPRITYQVGVSDLDHAVPMTASLWYRSRSWEEITIKAEEINDYIGTGGVMVPYDGGAIWITRGAPFYQRMGDPDEFIRHIVISISAEYIC